MDNAHPIVFIDEKNLKKAFCRFAGREFPVYVGRDGAIAEKDKKEGDWKTPYGIYPLRHVYYRPDQIDAPDTDLPVTAITEASGWCDDPNRPEYNRYVQLPYDGSHEKMYRQDRLYNLVVEIGHNDNPPVPGMGSAVFLHLKRPEKDYTAGCVGFDDQDLKYILKNIGHNPKIEIRPV
tara:strand:+ start:4253 stop:4786 length:534 start_codon:yes stop_codon:yes gene_type:complete